MIEWLAVKIDPRDWGTATLPDSWKWIELPKTGAVATSIVNNKHVYVQLQDILNFVKDLTPAGEAKLNLKYAENTEGACSFEEMMKELDTSTTATNVEQIPEVVMKIIEELRSKGFEVKAGFLDDEGNLTESEPEESVDCNEAGSVAEAILAAGAETLQLRAKERDQDKERSMDKIVKAFNAITGKELTTREGWLFMALLKMVRSQLGNEFRPDDYIDGVNYFALAGEAHEAEEDK